MNEPPRGATPPVYRHHGTGGGCTEDKHDTRKISRFFKLPGKAHPLLPVSSNQFTISSH